MSETAAREGIPAPALRVIGPGFGPCDHMLENLEHPERFALWEEALRSKWSGRPIDWRPLLTGFRAIVDWPGAYFWRELTAAHPEAKVIFTVRDPERWYDSMYRTRRAADGPLGGIRSGLHRRRQQRRHTGQSVCWLHRIASASGKAMLSSPVAAKPTATRRDVREPVRRVSVSNRSAFNADLQSLLRAAVEARRLEGAVAIVDCGAPRMESAPDRLAFLLVRWRQRRDL